MLRRRFSTSELFSQSDLRSIYQLYLKTREMKVDPLHPYAQNVKAINLSVYRSMHLEYEKNLRPQLSDPKYSREAAEILRALGCTVHFPAEGPFCELRGSAAGFEFTISVKGYIERDEASLKTKQGEQGDLLRELRKHNLSPSELHRHHSKIVEQSETIDDRYMFKHGGYYLTETQNAYYRSVMNEQLAQERVARSGDLFDFEAEFVDIVPFEISLRNAASGQALRAEGQVVDL